MNVNYPIILSSVFNILCLASPKSIIVMYMYMSMYTKLQQIYIELKNPMC